jgi:chromosome segregation ATPase
MTNASPAATISPTVARALADRRTRMTSKTAARDTRTTSTRAADRLLQRIRTLVRQANRDGDANKAELRAQRGEIDDLKSQLAEVVKQNSSGDEHE